MPFFRRSAWPPSWSQGHSVHARLLTPLYLLSCQQIDLWLTAAFVINLYTRTPAGRHWATLTAAEHTSALFWHNVLTAPSVLGLGLPKLAVVSLTCRIFKPSKLHQDILWVLAALCVLNFIVVILLAWLPCQPVAAAWDITIVDKKCLDPWIYVKYCYYATCEFLRAFRNSGSEA